MQGQINISGNAIKLNFDYDPVLVSKARKLPGRRYEPSSKSWIVPIMHFDDVIKTFPDFKVSEEAKKTIAIQKEKENQVINMSSAAGADMEVPGLKGELMPFQKAGVQYIEKTSGHTLIADEMGLGKTVQSLAWLQLHPEIRPAVIICPASLKLNWRIEAEKWLEDRQENIIYVVKNGKDKIPEGAKVIIINYDLIKDRLDKLIQLVPQVVILDESHYIKNNKAIRAKAAMQLGKQAKHVLCLSGTPFLNRPIEIWTTLILLAPKLFPNWKYFATRYCGGYMDSFGWNVSGASHLDELQDILRKNIMVRREKQQVLAELPDKQHIQVPVEIINRKEYDLARSSFLLWLNKTYKDKKKIEAAERAEALTRMNALRKLSAVGKIDAAKEWISNFIETGQKLVVFGHHREVLNTVYSSFKDCAVKLTGETESEERQEAVKKFQEDPAVKIFIASIKAAGVGITLTAANSVLFLEIDWTPAGNDQAEDRCHRIGQKNAVTVWHMTGYDTFDQDMYRTVVEKRQSFDAAFSLSNKGKAGKNQC